MPYLTAVELESAIGNTRLREIADPENTGAVNATMVGEAMRSAQSTIDRYVGKKYTVPLADPVPELVRQLMIDLTVYALKRRGRNMMTSEDTVDEALKLSTLKDVASGAIVLDVTILPTPAPMVIDKAGDREASPLSTTKAASRASLKGPAW